MGGHGLIAGIGRLWRRPDHTGSLHGSKRAKDRTPGHRLMEAGVSKDCSKEIARVSTRNKPGWFPRSPGAVSQRVVDGVKCYKGSKEEKAWEGIFGFSNLKA